MPRADYKLRPIYIGENPYKGTYKRNHEGDCHATEYEIRGMIRDQNPDGNDSLVLEHYNMDDIDQETLSIIEKCSKHGIRSMYGIFMRTKNF